MEIIHEFSIIHGYHAIIIEWFSIITNQWPKSAMDVQNCWVIEPNKLLPQIFPHLFSLNFFSIVSELWWKYRSSRIWSQLICFLSMFFWKIRVEPCFSSAKKCPLGYTPKSSKTLDFLQEIISVYGWCLLALPKRESKEFLLLREYFYKVGVTPRLVSRSLKWVDNWKLGRMVKFNFLPNLECSRCNFPIFSSTEAFLRIITF